MLAQAMELEEPSIRNSNLLPVKAKGEVRLRSVVFPEKAGKHVHAQLHFLLFHTGIGRIGLDGV